MKEENNPVPPEQNDLILNVLKLERITKKDIARFSKADKKKLMSVIQINLGQLTDDERDAYLVKVGDIMDTPFKNRLWQRNHVLIGQAISDYKKQYGTGPDKSDIADMTGLSLATVYKHFKHYRNSNMQLILEQYEFMAPQILDALYTKGIKGDVPAARLLLKILNNPPANGFGTSKVRIDDFDPEKWV